MQQLMLPCLYDGHFHVLKSFLQQYQLMNVKRTNERATWWRYGCKAGMAINFMRAMIKRHKAVKIACFFEEYREGTKILLDEM